MAAAAVASRFIASIVRNCYSGCRPANRPVMDHHAAQEIRSPLGGQLGIGTDRLANVLITARCCRISGRT